MKDHCSAGSCPYRKDDTLCTSKIRLFRSLPVEAQEQLIAHSVPSTHPKGTILLQEGQQIDSILIIRKGRLKTCRLEANGEEHVLDILHDGQAIWHDMFLKDPVYHYSVVCLTDVSAEAKEKILLLSIRDPEVRLAGFLLDRDTRCIGPYISMRLDDIAASISLRPETVSRNLTKLEKKGLIRRIGQGKIQVIDRPTLQLLFQSASAD